MPHDMRRTPSQASKADQIIQNFFSKVAQVITQARLIQYDSLSSGSVPLNTNLNPRQTLATHYPKRPNKWFNLELWDSDAYKEDLKYWRHSATSTGLPPYIYISNPMVIEFFLDTSELPKNKILVITDENSRKRKVDVHISNENEDGKSKNILLESWQLTLRSSTDLPLQPPDLPVVYKKSIAFFRSLYAYLRLLPAFRLYKRIKTKLNHDLKIGYRFVLPNTEYIDDIGIDVPIIEGETGNDFSQFTFSSIDTPIGVLSLKVDYRTNCEFHIDESEEEIISANFMVDFDLDEQFFTPTVVKYHQEQEQRRQMGSEERRKSVPTRMNTPPSGYLFMRNSPQYNNPLLGGTPRSNPEIKEYSNTDLTFPKIHAPPSHPPSTFASTLSNNTTPGLTFKPSDSRRSFDSPTSSRSGRHDNLSSSRPNVTLVQPFKSPSLSSSPSQDNLPSPTFSERSSPLHRSPSSLSLQQRSSRPLSTSGGVTLSSSIKSNSSAGSLPKFSSSFSYRHERNSGSSGRESVSSRKRSRSSLTNNDGSTSDFNSSFFASLEPDDNVDEFIRLVGTHDPLKMFSRSPAGSAGSAGSDDSGNPGVNMSGSVHKSKQLQQLQLFRFQKNKESYNTLSDSITSLTLQSGPQQLEPPSSLTLGTSSGSISSSMSSISKSTHPPNVPSKLIPNKQETRALKPESSNITSGRTLEKGTEIQTDNVIIKDYSSYSGELGVGGVRHVDSSSSLPSQQHNQLYNETNSESRDSEINNEIMVGVRRGNAEGVNIPKSNVIKDNAFNDVLITAGERDITGSPASGNYLRAHAQEEELFFKCDSIGSINNDATKYEAINNDNNNTLETTMTATTKTEKETKMTHTDKESSY